ncbi:chromosomal replication initiator protein DnaA [Thermocrinis minervae]|uniref:Chromosomal replication initiator protein DnaA n=1 Tax=Thermocrinis minervae TaxID=381751 RepID=A0A1M6RVM9_9AQUI|nr:chromosomal replication initiator protein DnaA [Thermocrinis minervae]SHK36552.1 chromosomal replication initiator protein DnaA [Thermocrinis minervae]
MQEGIKFLKLIERLDRLALSIFQKFVIEEYQDHVVLRAPSEEYKAWAENYIRTRLIGFPKRLEVVFEEKHKKGIAYHVVDKYTFDNYVVGPSNELVYKVCLEVAQNPGTAFNPLFIYGGVGLGKTHLLHAIGNLAASKGYKVAYTSANDFSDEMVKFLKADNIEAFREKYTNLDILLLDDIQFLAGKERTQVELFRISEKMMAQDKQIVLVSDRHPKDLKDIPDRLISRFESGLVLQVGLDDKTKLSIIRQKLALMGLPIDEKVVNYIFENTGYNVREIEGAIKTLKVVGVEKTLQSAKEKRNVDLDFVVSFVAKSFGLKPSELLKDSREKKIQNARQVSMYLAKKVINCSYVEISRYFGKKDHTTAIYAVKKVEERMRTDRKFNYMVSFLEKSLLEAIRKR